MTAPLPSEVVARATSPSIDEARPRTYGDCLARDLGGEGSPCPWVGCKYHLAVDVDRRGGLELHTPDASGEDIDWDAILLSGAPTCALRAAGADQGTLLSIGALFGVSRGRVRQIETKAIGKLRGRAERLHLDEHLVDEVDADDARRSRSEARGGVGAVRPAEVSSLQPPPASWRGLVGVERVRTGSDVFWCGHIGTALSAALCAQRHAARRRHNDVRAGNAGEPIHRQCARCPGGAVVAKRVGTAGEPDAARKARVVLHVLQERRAVSVAPPAEPAPAPPAEPTPLLVVAGPVDAPATVVEPPPKRRAPPRSLEERIVEHLQGHGDAIVTELHRKVAPRLELKIFRASVDALVREGRLVRPHFGWVAIGAGGSP